MATPAPSRPPAPDGMRLPASIAPVHKGAIATIRMTCSVVVLTRPNATGALRHRGTARHDRAAPVLCAELRRARPRAARAGPVPARDPGRLEPRAGEGAAAQRRRGPGGARWLAARYRPAAAARNGGARCAHPGGRGLPARGARRRAPRHGLRLRAARGRQGSAGARARGREGERRGEPRAALRADAVRRGRSPTTSPAGASSPPAWRRSGRSPRPSRSRRRAPPPKRRPRRPSGSAWRRGATRARWRGCPARRARARARTRSISSSRCERQADVVAAVEQPVAHVRRRPRTRPRGRTAASRRGAPGRPSPRPARASISSRTSASAARRRAGRSCRSWSGRCRRTTAR